MVRQTHRPSLFQRIGPLLVGDAVVGDLEGPLKSAFGFGGLRLETAAARDSVEIGIGLRSNGLPPAFRIALPKWSCCLGACALAHPEVFVQKSNLQTTASRILSKLIKGPGLEGW